MSKLFTPVKLGDMEIKNQIIAAATIESMATGNDRSKVFQ